MADNQISISPVKGSDRSLAGTSKVLTFEEKVQDGDCVGETVIIM